MHLQRFNKAAPVPGSTGETSVWVSWWEGEHLSGKEGGRTVGREKVDTSRAHDLTWALQSFCPADWKQLRRQAT